MQGPELLFIETRQVSPPEIYIRDIPILDRRNALRAILQVPFVVALFPPKESDAESRLRGLTHPTPVLKAPSTQVQSRTTVG